MKRIRIVKAKHAFHSAVDEATSKDLNQTGSQIVAETIKVLEKAKVQFFMAVQNSKDEPANQKVYFKNQKAVEQCLDLLKRI